MKSVYSVKSVKRMSRQSVIVDGKSLRLNRVYVLLLLVVGSLVAQISAVEVLSQASYRGGEAKAVVQIQRADDGSLALVAEFRPDTTQPGDWHFYDKDFVGQYGLPTTLALQAGGWIQSTGAVTADQKVKTIDFFGEQLAVYPDGPVVLRQPVTLVNELPAASTPAQVQISYMLCSNEICQLPQEAIPLDLGKSTQALDVAAIGMDVSGSRAQMRPLY